MSTTDAGEPAGLARFDLVDAAAIVGGGMLGAGLWLIYSLGVALAATGALVLVLAIGVPLAQALAQARADARAEARAGGSARRKGG